MPDYIRLKVRIDNVELDMSDEELPHDCDPDEALSESQQQYALRKVLGKTFRVSIPVEFWDGSTESEVLTDFVLDLISDKTGWCVNSLSYTVLNQG